MSFILTRVALARMFPRAGAATLDLIYRAQRDGMHRFGINHTKRRLAYFLAQAAEESAGFTTFTEMLNYTLGRAKQVWPARAASFDKMVKPGQAHIEAAKRKLDPVMLANETYGNRMGNGPPASGDGWKYRGRGPIQLTGRANYKSIGLFLGIDLESQPDLALDPKYLMLVLTGYWAKGQLNGYADAGNFTGLTRGINGGLTNLDERQRWLREVNLVLSNSTSYEDAVPTSPIAEPMPAPQPAPTPTPPATTQGGIITRLLRSIFGGRQ